jgi:hypothetical protein
VAKTRKLLHEALSSLVREKASRGIEGAACDAPDDIYGFSCAVSVVDVCVRIALVA